MPPTIRSLLMLPMPSRNVKLVSSVPPSLLMRPESKSSTLNTCGKAPMVPSEISSTVLSSENQSSSTTSQDLFQDGKNQSSLEDMLSVINTEPPISQLTDQELSRSFSEIMKEKKKEWKSTNSKEKEVLAWQCTMLTKALKILPTAVSNSPLKDSSPFT